MKLTRQSVCLILVIFFVTLIKSCSSKVTPDEPDTVIQYETTPVVYAPSALTGRGVSNEVNLEWNPSLEDDIRGYHVYRRHPDADSFERITQYPVETPVYSDSGLTNQQRYVYRVTAVLQNGVESEHSNVIGIIPSHVEAPQTVEDQININIPGHQNVAVDEAIKVTFGNGHSIVFDKQQAQVRAWSANDGTHLKYPRRYGNPIDLTEFDQFGISRPQPADGLTPAIPPRINLDYTHPDGPERVQPWFVEYTVSDDAVTFHYRIPLTGPGVTMDAQKDLWIWADVWETWYPLERELYGTQYSGLARKIELKLPSYYDDGYSVCLNDGFGVNGSCEGALTYQLRWGKPHLQSIAWQRGVPAQGVGEIRGSRGFHPTQWTTQVQPFLFARYPSGTLLIAPQQYYHATSFVLSNHVEQGRDGLWPNYKIDVATAGKRFTVETFEYLWTPDTHLEAPQQWMDASFYYRRQLAELYQLTSQLTSMSYAWDYWGPGAVVTETESRKESFGILQEWAEKTANAALTLNVDLLGGAHELWTSSPYTVSEEIRLDPDHRVNQAIAEMVREFTDQGIRFSYWVRPEFVKTALPNVLSHNFINDYYGYTSQRFPPAFPRLTESGIPVIRNNPGWIRTGRDGTYPQRTPYNWTPMSITLENGWYQNVMYKSLLMMKELGYSTLFQDGGFSSLTGVDYTGGKAKAIQPYYWRYFQDVNRLGIDRKSVV